MLLCAEIVNTHGIRGEVKALIYADGAEFFDGIKTLYAEKEEPLTIEKCRAHKGSLIIKFKEINTIDDAEQYKKKKLYVKRGDAPALPEGRYFIADIIGCEVITDTGRNLGKVEDVIQAGSCDIYTVRSPEGRQYMIPVTDEVVKTIDIDKKEILITPIKGLLDDED